MATAYKGQCATERAGTSGAQFSTFVVVIVVVLYVCVCACVCVCVHVRVRV